ncbi:endonuclease V, partial [Catenaria anguillulae PL171]
SDHNLGFTVPTVDGSEWPNLRLIAGVDISFIDDHEPGAVVDDGGQAHDSQDALACVVVCEWPHLRPVYQDYLRVPLTVPYIPGFLAFREVEPLKQLIDRIPHAFTPQVVLVDGNGTLHPRRFGLACHLGILTNLPTIGIGKNFLHIPAEGDQLSMAYVKARAHSELVRGGDHFLLQGQQLVYGAAVRVLDSAKNPVFVSVGHRVALDTAVRLVVACCKFRVPEPVRLADLMSRDVVRRIQRAANAS